MTALSEALQFYADKVNWETVSLEEARKRLGGKDPYIEINCGCMNFKAPAGKALAPALTDNGDRARQALSAAGAEVAGVEELIERLESHMGRQEVPVLLADCREAAQALRTLSERAHSGTNLPVTRCDYCGNGVEPEWEFCAWCSRVLKDETGAPHSRALASSPPPASQQDITPERGEVSNELVVRQKMDALSRCIQRLRSITENDFPPCLATGELDLMEQWLADLRTAHGISLNEAKT